MSEFEDKYLLNIVRESDIKAPADVTFAAILEEIGPGFTQMDGTPLGLKLEAWPGGRWYRDLGNNAGHFWGHVQVIKPGKLLEITGPMFMSFAVASHLQYRLTEIPGGTHLTVTHKALGEFPPDLKKNVHNGWDHILNRIIKRATR